MRRFSAYALVAVHVCTPAAAQQITSPPGVTPLMRVLDGMPEEKIGECLATFMRNRTWLREQGGVMAQVGSLSCAEDAMPGLVLVVSPDRDPEFKDPAEVVETDRRLQCAVTLHREDGYPIILFKIPKHLAIKPRMEAHDLPQFALRQQAPITPNERSSIHRVLRFITQRCLAGPQD